MHAPSASPAGTESPVGTASIVGTFTGLPGPRADRCASVLAIRLETFEVAAGAVSKGRPYTLRVAPGHYILAGDAFDVGGGKIIRGSRGRSR